jgi:RNA polymerase sigma-70 factor (ECF subfamily)
MTAKRPSCAGQAPALETPEFLDRLRRGDAEAFAELVRATGGRLLAVARRMLGNEEEARDALQDGFLAAHRALPGFRGTARVSTWLHRIVVNACLMKLRSRRRHPEAAIEDLLPRFDAEGRRVEAQLVTRPVAERALESAQTLAWIRRAAERLPLLYREVFVLRDVEELDTAEVADLLGVSDAVVKIRLHRARQALRTLLAQERPERAVEPEPRVRPRSRSDAGTTARRPSPAGDFGMLSA